MYAIGEANGRLKVIYFFLINCEKNQFVNRYLIMRENYLSEALNTIKNLFMLVCFLKIFNFC